MKRLITAFILIIAILNISVCFSNSIIYKRAKESKISAGAKLIQYELLTNDGWVIANVIEVDTTDEYTNIEILNAPEGNNSLASVMAMANAKNAVAAINGDFFSGRSGKGHAIGLAVNNGEILTSATEENNTNLKYATLFLDNDDNVFYDYLKNDITLYFNDTTLHVNHINRYNSYPEIPTIYNKNWGEMSLGKSTEEGIIEVVVEDGEVVEIREDAEPVLIPENGYVIRANSTGAEVLRNNLSIGDTITYDIEYTPNIDNIKLAISGGAILIENGQIPETFSHNVTGRNPRTIVGTNKNESIFYLITIDGRISKSIGMTLEETAEFLKSIDIYTAINLDGGGSTTMVAKKLGKLENSEINTPSGGTERLVANAIGAVSTAPDSEKLDGLEIIMDDTNIFANEKRKVKVIGYNQYYNPVEISEDEIRWDYDGVKVDVEDGEVTGSEVGETTLIAKIGKVKGTLDINILSEVNEIFISPKSIVVAPNENVKFTLKAKNINGYYASTNDDTYETKIEKYYKDGKLMDYIPDNAKLENLSFTASESGTYIISFSKGNCTSYAKVDIGNQKFVVLDDFENKSFYFDPYPDEVGGDAIHSDVQAHSGKYSAKLEYDFDRDAKIRGAYIVFNEFITIPKDAIELAFWVYNDAEKDEKLKVKLIDAGGHTKLVVIQDNILHEGWEEIKLDLSGYDLPVKITDVYLAQDNENIRKSGFIYVDDFGYYTNKNASGSNIKLPKDIKVQNTENNDILTDESYKIAFIDTIENKNNLMIELLKNKLLVRDINKNVDEVLITNDTSEKFISNYFGESGEKISKKYHQNIGYDIISNDYVTMITMDISQNSIRKSDGTQFEYLQNDILDEDTGNIIIVLNNSIDNFTDLKERQVFVDMLCDLHRETNKNIVVVHDGYFNDLSMERGIRFLGINSSYNEPIELASYSYLIISIKDNEISYEYKNIF